MTCTGTPATPHQTIQLGIVPYSSDITVEEELETGEEQAPIGAHITQAKAETIKRRTLI